MYVISEKDIKLWRIKVIKWGIRESLLKLQTLSIFSFLVWKGLLVNAQCQAGTILTNEIQVLSSFCMRKEKIP